jgi:hypothetical protein
MFLSPVRGRGWVRGVKAVRYPLTQPLPLAGERRKMAAHPKIS